MTCDIVSTLGKPNLHTRELVVNEGGFMYDSDAYNDDLPYWTFHPKGEGTILPHLVVPYTLVNNDMNFVRAGGFATGQAFLTHLKDTLDVLVKEGRAGQPKMMTVLRLI